MEAKEKKLEKGSLFLRYAKAILVIALVAKALSALIGEKPIGGALDTVFGVLVILSAGMFIRHFLYHETTLGRNNP